jgi:hypothetical protein
MELGKVTISIIFIFLPGILALMVSERLTSHRERKGYELAAYTFVIGCLSHLLYFTLHWLLGKFSITSPEDNWLDLMTSDTVAQPTVVLITTILGVVLGFVLCYASNYSWLHRFASLIHAGNKFGDVDVWAWLLNSGHVEGNPWVVIRDQEKSLMYQGWVMAHSVEEDPRELVLSDVKVFDNKTGAELYDVKVMYMALEKKSASIELYNGGQ